MQTNCFKMMMNASVYYCDHPLITFNAIVLTEIVKKNTIRTFLLKISCFDCISLKYRVVF